MASQFTSCPACGAVGEIGNNCQFCGTTIQAKEGNVITNSRVVNIRTVTPQEYANKIAIYHEIKTKGNLAVVRIGDQYGVINLNGDLVYPLSGKYKYVSIESDLVIKVDFGTVLNIETLEEAYSTSGFGDVWRVTDKNNAKYFHRLYDKKTWKIDNIYTNNNGEIHKFNYGENLGRGMYLLHKDNYCTFVYGSNWNWWKVGMYTTAYDITIFIENVKNVGKIFKDGTVEYIPLEMINGKTINFPLHAGKITKEEWNELYHRCVTMEIGNHNLDKIVTKNSSTYEKEENPKSFFSGIFKFSLWVILFFIIRWIWRLL